MKKGLIHDKDPGYLLYIRGVFVPKLCRDQQNRIIKTY